MDTIAPTATYADVEKLKYGVTGDTFTAAQITIVTALLLHADALVSAYCTVHGLAPASDTLKIVEATIGVTLLNNADGTHDPPHDPFPAWLRVLLDVSAPREEEPFVCGSVKTWGIPDTEA